jgi:hypothetical protein
MHHGLILHNNTQTDNPSPTNPSQMATPTAAAVQQLLQALLSPENAARAKAEAGYNSLLASAGAGEVAAALLDTVATQQGGAENSIVR